MLYKFWAYLPIFFEKEWDDRSSQAYFEHWNNSRSLFRYSFRIFYKINTINGIESENGQLLISKLLFTFFDSSKFDIIQNSDLKHCDVSMSNQLVYHIIANRMIFFRIPLTLIKLLSSLSQSPHHNTATIVLKCWNHTFSIQSFSLLKDTLVLSLKSSILDICLHNIFYHCCNVHFICYLL